MVKCVANRTGNSENNDQAVNNWWNTARKDGALVNLTPTAENREMVPFLQMANGETNKVGCAYHVCNEEEYGFSEEHGYDQKAFVLFVCTYGDPQIKVGSPIYTEGPPCDSCKDRCIFNHALCDTKIA
ncbi:hypothetical protein DICVIV_11096 [Dictyocaulus viviparus]|uniref:SCP domain-containing protein n=1 Tax=Dictyocaulus viviparus TaxID=29172 RepID=A0A0D8XE45_DICVI|nr:hypothetical protein DICVIV_11096 [Dictyocaulus viviparus]